MQTLSQKLITKHQWHICTYHTLQNCWKEVEIQFVSTWIMFPSLLPQFGRAFFTSKEGGVQYFCSYNECKVIGVWWWVCGSFKVTPEAFSWDQTSQVLPHGLNHHFSLILVLYTETLSCYNRKESCPNCWYNITIPLNIIICLNIKTCTHGNY